MYGGGGESGLYMVRHDAVRYDTTVNNRFPGRYVIIIIMMQEEEIER